MMKSASRFLRLSLGGCAMLGACETSVATTEESRSDIEAEEQECPSEITYKKAAKPFFDAYCRGCHSRAGQADGGPEVPHMLTTESEVRKVGAHVYEAIESRTMPPLDENPDLPKPSSKERKAVLEWLDCSGANSEPTEDHH